MSSRASSVSSRRYSLRSDCGDHCQCSSSPCLPVRHRRRSRRSNISHEEESSTCSDSDSGYSFSAKLNNEILRRAIVRRSLEASMDSQLNSHNRSRVTRSCSINNELVDARKKRSLSSWPRSISPLSIPALESTVCATPSDSMSSSRAPYTFSRHNRGPVSTIQGTVTEQLETTQSFQFSRNLDKHFLDKESNHGIEFPVAYVRSKHNGSKHAANYLTSSSYTVQNMRRKHITKDLKPSFYDLFVSYDSPIHGHAHGPNSLISSDDEEYNTSGVTECKKHSYLYGILNLLKSIFYSYFCFPLYWAVVDAIVLEKWLLMPVSWNKVKSWMSCGSGRSHSRSSGDTLRRKLYTESSERYNGDHSYHYRTITRADSLEGQNHQIFKNVRHDVSRHSRLLSRIFYWTCLFFFFFLFFWYFSPYISGCLSSLRNNVVGIFIITRNGIGNLFTSCAKSFPAYTLPFINMWVPTDKISDNTVYMDRKASSESSSSKDESLIFLQRTELDFMVKRLNSLEKLVDLHDSSLKQFSESDLETLKLYLMKNLDKQKKELDNLITEFSEITRPKKKEVEIDMDAITASILPIVLKEVGNRLMAIETRVSKSCFANPTADTENLKKLINQAILKYNADKTELPDLALESSGGSIISTRCTRSSKLKNSVISVWGITLWTPPNNPRKIIQPGATPGDCWAFEGSVGDVVIQLLGPSVVTGFTMEHIPKSISPYGVIDSAPYEFMAVGLMHLEDPDGFIFGTFRFEDNGEPLQYFEAKNLTSLHYPLIELKILSNHGSLAHTCVYRFRVHGQLAVPEKKATQ